jgi:hypothetical protein
MGTIPYQLPKRSIRCKRLGRSQLKRQIHEKIPLEGIRLDDMGSSTTQSQIVFSNSVEIISKQLVLANVLTSQRIIVFCIAT